MVVKTTRLTAAEFGRVADRLGPCELVRGEVIFLSPGGMSHSGVSANAAFLLGLWARRSRCGRVFANEAGLITERTPDTVRGADVAYFSYQRLPKGEEPAGFSPIPPELVVDILGKRQGRPQMLEKAAEYLNMGVDRVWIIDPKTRGLHVLRSDVEPQVLGQRALLRDPDVLPGFKVRVKDFFQ